MHVIVSLQNSVSNIEGTKDDDLLLRKACDDYEKNLSHINLGGILQGANLQNVSINININK